MYSDMATPSADTYLPQGPKPIFVQSRDAPRRDSYITGEELYIALTHSVDRHCITGVQRIGSLWRIYVNNHEARVRLISNGLVIRNTTIPVYDTNPYTKAKNEHLTRVLIKDIPLSVSDELIKSTLEKMKCQVRSDIIRQKLRVNGELIDCLNGDRVCFIDPPSRPLPRSFVIANLFRARAFHIGQPERVTKCSRCLQTGHHSSQCSDDVKCKTCDKTGHISSSCPNVNNATPTESRNNIADRDACESAKNPGSKPRDHEATLGARPKVYARTPQQKSDVIRSPSRKPRHQANITGFLRSSTNPSPFQSEDQCNSTDVAEECDTGDELSTDVDEFQSPLSPETPSPTKAGKKPPKRKRKDKSNKGN